MSPVDKVLALATLTVLLAVIAIGLWHEHRLEQWRDTLDRPIVDDAYLSAIDAAVDEVAARRALRPVSSDVSNVVPMRSRKRDGAA
jgi:hypothetical protein